MSDSSGYIYDEAVIDDKKLAHIMEIKNVKRGRIKEYVKKYKNAKYFEGEKPWSVKCDIALPCATQNELNQDEAKALIKNGASVVAEGANMPCTPEAVEEFHKARIFFAPGKASNAGGVATSGLEMSQNSMRYNWTSEEVDQKLQEIMKDIHHSCVQHGCDEKGFVKVADAMIAQGIV